MNDNALIYSISILLFIMAGCSDDDISNNKYSEKITFSTRSNNEAHTRGTPIMSSDDLSDICVYGYYTGDGGSNEWANVGSTAIPSLFNGVTVTNSNVGTSTPSWSYQNIKFWPKSNDANVSFFAYSPTATTLNGIEITNTAGVPSLHYSTPTTTVDQPDLMVAIPRLDLNRTSASPVVLTMEHALTCIGFQAVGNGKVIESITLSGISLEGDLSMDGSEIKWSNISEPVSTTIEVGLDDGTLSSSMSTNLTASNGYLMLIPQTLKSDAKMTVKFQGDETKTFSFTDSVWSAGQFIDYQLIVVRPEGSLTVSPSDITLSALGVDTDSVTVSCTPYYATWTLTSPVPWVKFSLNKNGSNPESTVSGVGNSKVYIVVEPNLLNTMQPRIADIYANSQSSDVKLTITQNSMMNIPSSKKSYAGAFWRREQIGERLIHIPSNIGSWKAFVFWMDDRWEEGDIILDASPFQWPASPVSVTSDTPALLGTETSISGSTSSSGAINFRVGLKSRYSANSTYPARYALLALTWDNDESVQFFFIRQGEDPDYIMRPTDEYGNDQSWASAPNWRPKACKISPFNLTADTLNIQCNRERDGKNPSRFTDYPSQAGAFFQWANTVNTRFAYSPVSNPPNEIWNYTWPDTYWADLASVHESSPSGFELTYGETVNFRRINNGIITGATTTSVEYSEIVQSFYYEPYSPIDNMIYAYIADGYFDRLESSSDNGVNVGSDDVGYWGQLIYNPINKASIVIPYTGYLIGESGAIKSEGI